MPCSPSYLFTDITLWLTPGFFDRMLSAYQNHSNSTNHRHADCALTTVPCASDVIEALVSLDHTLYYWFDLIVVNVFLTTLVVLGVIGNVLNIVVFSRHQIVGDSTNVLLLAVSTSDLLNLLVNAWLLCTSFLCYFDVGLALTAFNVSIAFIGITTRFLSLLSLDLVTAVSMQRAVAVVFPFKAADIFSTRNTKLLVVGLALLWSGSNSYIFFVLTPRWLHHPYLNVTVSLGYTRVVSHSDVISYSTYYLNSRSAIDMILLFITGSFTVARLRSQVKSRAVLKATTTTTPTSASNSTKPSTTNNSTTNSKSKMSGREASMVKMSMTVCLFTFILYSLSMARNEIMQLYLQDLFASPLPVINMYCIFVLNSVCSSFNFYLYLTMSAKYRQVVGSWFCLTKATDKENN